MESEKDAIVAIEGDVASDGCSVFMTCSAGGRRAGSHRPEKVGR